MDVRVVSLVEDSIYVAALPNEPGQAELGEVLGDRRRLSPRCHARSPTDFSPWIRIHMWPLRGVVLPSVQERFGGHWHVA